MFRQGVSFIENSQNLLQKESLKIVSLGNNPVVSSEKPLARCLEVLTIVYHLWSLTIFAYTYMAIIHFLCFYIIPLFCQIESNSRCLHAAQEGVVGTAMSASGQSTVGLNRS